MCAKLRGVVGPVDSPPMPLEVIACFLLFFLYFVCISIASSRALRSDIEFPEKPLVHNGAIIGGVWIDFNYLRLKKEQ